MSHFGHLGVQAEGSFIPPSPLPRVLFWVFVMLRMHGTKRASSFLQRGEKHQKKDDWLYERMNESIYQECAEKEGECRLFVMLAFQQSLERSKIVIVQIHSHRNPSRLWIVATSCLLACALSVLFLRTSVTAVQAAPVLTSAMSTQQARPMGLVMPTVQAQDAYEEAVSANSSVSGFSSSIVSKMFLQEAGDGDDPALPAVYWRDGHLMWQVQPLSWCSGVLKGKFC